MIDKDKTLYFICMIYICHIQSICSVAPSPNNPSLLLKALTSLVDTVCPNKNIFVFCPAVVRVYIEVIPTNMLFPNDKIPVKSLLCNKGGFNNGTIDESTDPPDNDESDELSSINNGIFIDGIANDELTDFCFDGSDDLIFEVPLG